MLVLTRRRAESIKIGNDVVIKVIQTGRGMVRLGIEAPANVRVLRGELAEFSDDVVAVSATPSENHDSETEDQVESEATADEESHFHFTTDYVMEIENQMACVTSRR